MRVQVPPFVRSPHPCVEPPCGHSEAEHVPTPELAAPGEVVVFCSECRRHEVRMAGRAWSARRGAFVLAWALPLSPV